MSLRNIRKLYGANEIPRVENSEEEEYEPLYMQRSAPASYGALMVDAESPTEADQDHESEVEQEAPVEAPSTSQETGAKKKNKKKKNKKNKRNAQLNNEEEMDEIDRSVMEVNAIMGTPKKVQQAVPPPPDPKKAVMTVLPKNLNFNNELRRMFGPDEEELRRRGRPNNLARLSRRGVIVPLSDRSASFRKNGLSMGIDRKENGITYFTFNHSKDYQKRNEIYQLIMRQDNQGNGNNLIMLDDARADSHIEGLLEGADTLFQMEEYTAGNGVIEHAISYMQFVAHTSFNLADLSVRLEYKVRENRPFHVALLKHLHLMSNRACHRTALEIAKVMMNLDPSDPLAVLFIIDTLALRAREHEWLVKAVDYWDKERQAGMMFNIKFSYALAHFHVALKNKEDTGYATNLLEDAIYRFPAAVAKILECANLPFKHSAHDFFKSAHDIQHSLRDLMTVYGKFTWQKWKEPQVLEWLQATIDQAVQKYDSDREVKLQVQRYVVQSMNLFVTYPEQVARHLVIIKPIFSHLVDSEMTLRFFENLRMDRTLSLNPFPPADSIDRYNYDTPANRPAESAAFSVMPLFNSLLPSYEVEPQERA